MKTASYLFCLLLALPAVAVSYTAQAQDVPNPPYVRDVTRDVIRYPGLNQGDTTPGTPALPDGFELTVAAGATVHPDYAGSDDHEIIFTPALDLEYKQRLFAVADRAAMMVPYEGVGIKLLATQDFSAGFNLTYDHGRDDDNAFITGIGQMDPTVLGGGFVVWHPGMYFLRGQLAYDLLDQFGGFKGEVGGGITGPIAPQVRGIVEATGYYGGENYNEAYFGVPPGNASGLAGYNADSGFYKIRFTGGLLLQYTSGVFIEGLVHMDNLIGEAKDSPIVQDDTQFIAQGLVGYKF